MLEARSARGEQDEARRLPIDDDDPALADDDRADLHRRRVAPGGVRSLSKGEHLARMAASGYFAFNLEVCFDEPAGGGAERFIALIASQGSYQRLIRLGLTDGEIGMTAFAGEVEATFNAAAHRSVLSFSWRARLGVASGPASR